MENLDPRQQLIADIDAILAKAITADEKPSEDPIQKSEDAQTTPTEDKPTEDKVEKSLDQISDASAKGDVSLDANGGGDVIKNKDDKDDKLEDLEKENKDDKTEKAKCEKCGKAGCDGKCAAKCKKSVEMTDEEYEIFQKSLKAEQARKEEDRGNDSLYKSISALTDLVKGLQEKVETLSKEPARERKSLSGYEPVQKSQATPDREAPKMKKSDVSTILEDLLRKGQVADTHVCEFEATSNISDPEVRKLVKSEWTTRFKK